MKKILTILTTLLFAFGLTGCLNAEEDVSVIVPTGTPSLGIARALEEDFIKENIVSGSDPLIAAFTNANYDIVVAPVNLGAKFYNENENFGYQLYETIVWGNYYLASTTPLDSFASLEGKTITVFGKNSTPDVVLRTLLAVNQLNVTLEYVDDVNTANSYLMSGKADIIVSAEPSITKLSSNKEIYTLDLQKEWANITGSYSFPQAGIFVKKERKDNNSVQAALDQMIASIHLIETNPNRVVQSAVAVDENLAKITEKVLQQAILKCNLRIDENNQAAITFYFNKVIELGLGKTIGGKIPDEAFYYQK